MFSKAQNKEYIAYDQNGTVFLLHSCYPRAELLRILDRKKAKKMYVDKRDGTIEHTGYVIGGRWITVKEVK